MIDLGAAYHLTSFDLFNTHNAGYNDRGTGSFSIEASNSVGSGVNGSDLNGTVVTLVTGTLSAVSSANDPITGQSFTSSDGGSYRYIRFSPHSVASAGTPCCGTNVYGLNEVRVFEGAASGSVPEPATIALLGTGLAALGLIRRRRD